MGLESSDRPASHAFLLSDSPAASEYSSLTLVRDSELRAEGLLSLAGRQAQRNHPEITASIYSQLLEDSETPASVRERAQTRYDALRGEGEIGARAEVLLNRFVGEATEPTTLLAMTVAGAAFRATRFLTLTRLASSPSASLLTRGLGARAMAGLTGFGVEATVFPLAGRMGNLALGREQDWSRQALGRELASSFLMLGALKAGGLITGSLARRQSLLRPLVQQGGMFGGIVLGHELEVRAGLRPQQSGAMTLIDSLSTLLQFNVAGRLNQGLMGEGMRSWERSLEMRGEALSLPQLRLPQLPQASGLTPALASASQASPSTRAPETFGPDRVYMSSQDGDGGGKGKGPRPRSATDRTLPFITIPGDLQSPYLILSPLELGRRIQDPDLGFESRIREVDIQFEIRSSFDIEPYIPTTIETLNRLLKRGTEVEVGRKVTLNVHAVGEVSARRIILRRNASGFERVPDSSLPESPPSPRPDPLAKTIFAIPAVAEPAPRVEAPVGSRVVRAIKASHPLMVTDRMEQIPLLLRQLAEGREVGQSTPLLIAEGLTMEFEELKALTQDLAPRLPEQASFDLMIPDSQATWSGMRLGDRVNWFQQQTVQLKWQTANFHAVFPRIALQSVGELYQQIHAMSRKESRLPDAETVLQLQGAAAPEDIAAFTLRALNRYSVAGRTLRLELENGVAHEFTGAQGRWRSLEGSASDAPKPASRPPVGGEVSQYHLARWRQTLNQFLQEPGKISGSNHDFFLQSQVALSTGDLQVIRQRLQLGAGELARLKLFDQAGQKIYLFQRQEEGFGLEEMGWDQQLRWRPYEGRPHGAIEALDLSDLLRQLSGTFEGTESLHVLMRGPWSVAYAAMFLEGLSQGEQSLPPTVELHFEGTDAQARRQIYQRNSAGEWHFLEAPEGR